MAYTLIKSDYNRYKSTGSRGGIKVWFFNFGFICTCIYRINNYLYCKFKNTFLSKIFNVFAFLGLKFSQLLYGITIPQSTKIGEGLFISHNGPIIINGSAIIGKNCNIGPMVVIGWGKANGEFGVPEIGDRVFIAPGAVIFGPVKIGNDVAIGANSVVNFDVPDGGIVVGNPGKIVSTKGSSDYIHY